MMVETLEQAIPIAKQLGCIYHNSDGGVFFLRLESDTLELIRLNPDLLKDKDILTKLLKEKGDNFHIVRIFSDNTDTNHYVRIRKGFKEFVAKYNPKSISWFNQDMSKFCYWRM